MIERLWRSVKYEEVLLKDYQNVKEAKDGLGLYFCFGPFDYKLQAVENNY